MSLWQKNSRPVDRAIQELDKQRASVDQQLRRLEQQKSESHPPAAPGGGMSGFVKNMLAPTKGQVPTSYRKQRDLFEEPSDVIRDLDAQPIAFGTKSLQHDLYAGTVTAPVVTAQQKEKLAHYLSAGTMRTHRPTKSIQRRDRNRFLGWLGLAVATLWMLYVIVR